MQAEILSSPDPRWMTFLQSAPHDFYHLPGYVELCALQEGGEAAAFWAEDGDYAMLAPFVLRRVPATLEQGSELRDASAPYGYPGPLLKGQPPEGVVTAFLKAFFEVGSASGIVSAFFRFHPLLEIPEGPFRAFGTLLEHGETVYVDLTLPTEELSRQTRVNHRADARRLLAEGYRVEVDVWDRMPEFIRIYGETMRFRHAQDFYRFDVGYFEALRGCMGDHLHLCTVLAPEGAVAAAGLFTCVDGLMEFHLSGTADAYRRTGPAKLMLIHMRDWAKAHGQRLMHLGGGVGCAADSLAFFKQGFSRLRGRFSTFRMVLKPDSYRRLVRRRVWGEPAAPDQTTDFFPAYRRP
jgi:hypothetical protein